MAQTAEVRTYFEDSRNYFGTDECNVAIMQRQRIVKGFVDSVSFPGRISILDVGAGNGLISLPIQRSSDRLTLVDLSKNMICQAQCHANRMKGGNIDFVVGDVMNCNLPLKEYDMVLAMGLLAHVESVEAFLDRLYALTCPGGYLIIQNTDASHLWVRLYKLATRQRRIYQADSYALNEIASASLLKSLSERGFACTRSYRYELTVPLIRRVVGKTVHLAGVAVLFGTPPRNRFAGLGSKCVYMLRKNE